VREAMQLLLRSIRRHEVLNNVDQTLNLDMCSGRVPAHCG